MRGRAVLIAALVAALVPAGTAEAARLVRFTTTSRYVNPANPKVTFNDTHRPNLPPPSALPVNVLLPDGYDGRRRFPVLFLLHGHGDTYDSWIEPKNGDVLHVAPGLQAIVVMPEGGRGWYTDWWNGGRRGDPAWERYHLDELVPLIRKRFRIRHGRRWHAIAGLSMGGEGAMYYAEQRPGYFGSVASFSGVLSLQRPEWPQAFDTQGEKHQDVFGDPDAQSFYWSGHNPTALTGNLTHTRVFVAVGDGTPTHPGEVSNYFGALAEADLRQHANDFVSAASSKGVDVTYDPRRGIHDWPYWRQHLRDALHWGLFKNVVEYPIRWEFSTISRTSHAWGLRFEFLKAPTELATFERSGRFLIGAGSGTVRVSARGGPRVAAKLPFHILVPKGGRPRAHEDQHGN
jgi:S-formylglutathione hydrolase FrmB